MNKTEQHLFEQLSAWMDGALPAQEARFLQRRLEHDVELREQWERWQMASASLRGQALTAMPASLAPAIAAALAAEPTPGRPSATAGRWAWLATAAALALAIALVPRMGSEYAERGALAEAADARAPRVADSAQVGIPADLPTVEAVLAAQQVRGDQSPLRESVTSVRDFPLAVSATPRPWPRSPLIGREDAELQAYMVGHSEMAGGEALGGLLPLVDVATHDPGAAAAEVRRENGVDGE